MSTEAKGLKRAGDVIRNAAKATRFFIDSARSVRKARGDTMDVEARLAQEVQECLERISAFSWDVHARAIRRRAPWPAGDTFGFSEGGFYFDVGDSAEWRDEPEGDILLKAFVTAFSGPHDQVGIRQERSVILKSPNPENSN